MPTTYLDYAPRGAARQLFEPLALIRDGRIDEATEWGNRHAEILLEGPAGGGKSRAGLELVDAFCELFPGIRVLICRQTLKSLRQSVQVTLEDKVWYPTHPCITASDASREHRSSYFYPKSTNVVGGVTYTGASEIVLGGLDNPDRTFSTEYDIVLVEEAIETNLDAWMKLGRVNRNYRMPFQLQIAVTNPGSEYHYLNLRAEERDKDGDPIMVRMLSRHRDNPFLWDAAKRDWTPQGKQYVTRKLGHMRGAVRKRLLDGLWVSEEGQVWEAYDPAVHLLECELTFTDRGTWKLLIPKEQAKRSRLPRTVHLKWFFASMDFGLNPDPGVVQVWGVDVEGRMFRVMEVYRRDKHAEWWAGIVREIHSEFGLSRIVCDPGGSERILSLNYFLRHPGEALPSEPMSRIAIGGKNEIAAGIDIVDWALRPGMPIGDRDSDDPADYGSPRLFFCRSAFDKYGMDPQLLEERRPACTEHEIPSYVWPKREDGKPVKDKPNPLCEDHGCDALRYAVMFAFNKDLAPKEKAPDIIPGTMADFMGHKKVKKRPRF